MTKFGIGFIWTQNNLDNENEENKKITPLCINLWYCKKVCPLSKKTILDFI